MFYIFNCKDEVIPYDLIKVCDNIFTNRTQNNIVLKKLNCILRDNLNSWPNYSNIDDIL